MPLSDLACRPGNCWVLAKIPGLKETDTASTPVCPTRVATRVGGHGIQSRVRHSEDPGLSQTPSNFPGLQARSEMSSAETQELA